MNILRAVIEFDQNSSTFWMKSQPTPADRTHARTVTERVCQRGHHVRFSSQEPMSAPGHLRPAHTDHAFKCSRTQQSCRGRNEAPAELLFINLPLPSVSLASFHCSLHALCDRVPLCCVGNTQFGHHGDCGDVQLSLRRWIPYLVSFPPCGSLSIAFSIVGL